MYDMKYQVGQRMKKSKGYSFIGNVVSAFEVDGGNRYDIQIQADSARSFLQHLDNKYHFTELEYDQLYDYITNGDQMIHIFAEEQIEPYAEKIRV